MTHKLLECNQFASLGLCVCACVCVCAHARMCASLYLYKTEMKSGARLTEQLLGFHLVSPDLTGRLPQPLWSGSACLSRASVRRRGSEGAAHTSARKDTAKSSAKNLGKQTCQIPPRLLYSMKSFSSIPVKWNLIFLSASSPCNSV